MRSFISRARGSRLAPLATLLVAFALAACSDEHSVTAPSTAPNAAVVAMGDLAPAADTDSTRITFTIDDRAFFYPTGTGVALINGTVACSRAIGDQFYLNVRVEQKQPGRVLGVGYNEVQITCTTTAPQLWGLYVPAYGGYFDAGKAVVTVSVADAGPGVVQTSVTRNRRLLP